MGLYERAVFNPAMDWVLARPSVQAERARLLASARGAVLEIGVGTGLNLGFYPPEITHLTAAAPGLLDPRLLDRARRRGIAIEACAAGAEALPLASGTFDTVVSTFVLCTVGDPGAVVEELGRVLRPGGRLLFLEHVLRPPGLARALQRALDPLHRALACGCSLTRDTTRTLRSRFVLDPIDQLVLPGLPVTISRVIRGVGALVRGQRGVTGGAGTPGRPTG